MSHLKLLEINKLVQYKNNNNNYFNASNDDILKYETHLNQCAECLDRFTKSEQIYREMGQEKKKSVFFYKYHITAAAASILVFFTYYLFYVNNSQQDLSLTDFGIKVDRGSISDKDMSKIYFEFDTKDYNSILNYFEQGTIEKIDNKYYIAALSLKALAEKDVSLLNKALTFIKNDTLLTKKLIKIRKENF